MSARGNVSPQSQTGGVFASLALGPQQALALNSLSGRERQPGSLFQRGRGFTSLTGAHAFQASTERGAPGYPRFSRYVIRSLEEGTLSFSLLTTCALQTQIPPSVFPSAFRSCVFSLQVEVQRFSICLLPLTLNSWRQEGWDLVWPKGLQRAPHLSPEESSPASPALGSMPSPSSIPRRGSPFQCRK